jgi:DNA topoisomerase-1
MPRSRPARNEPEFSAKIAGLNYVSTQSPGIRRIGTNKTFRYLSPRGHVIRDPNVLARIKRLVIPPAWRNVWITTDPNGHLQAVGVDARGRKQYRYHASWRSVRDSTKFDRIVAFGMALPEIRVRVAADLKGDGLTRNKVLATIVRLLEVTSIRVGNEEYAKANRSFGLTTLRNHHVEVQREKMNFSIQRFSMRTKPAVIDGRYRNLQKA